MKSLGRALQKSGSYKALMSLASWLCRDEGFERVNFAMTGYGFREALGSCPNDRELLAPPEMEAYAAALLTRETADSFTIDENSSPAPKWLEKDRQAVIIPAIFSTKMEGCPGMDCCFSQWRNISASTKLCSARDFYTGEYCCARKNGPAAGWNPEACARCPLFPFAFVVIATGKCSAEAGGRSMELAKQKAIYIAEKSRWEKETRKARELDAAVTKVMIRMNETLDLKKRMTLLLGASVAILVADMGCVLISDPDDERVEVMASRNVPQGMWPCEGEQRSTLATHAEAVARDGKAVLLEDASLAEPGLDAEVRSAMFIPLRSKERVIGVLFLGNCTTSRGFCNADLVLMESLSVMSTAGIENALLYERMQAKEKLHRTLLAKIINAQEDERKRIAADIHDDTIQALISSFYRVEGAEMLLEGGSHAEVASELEQIKNGLQRNIRGMRRLLFDLRPSILDDAGLVPALENYVNRMEEETSLSSAFYVEEGIDRFAPEVEITIYRLAQEVLTNVRKHSKATEVALKMVRRGGSIELCIMDNGQGFDVDLVMQQGGYEEHLGLKSIMERAELAGGQVVIDSAPGDGAEIKIQIPETI